MEFKQNPTIENYVRLRRSNPDTVIEIAISSSLEWLFGNEEELERLGIPPLLVAGCLDADQEDISELSLLLLEKIIERKEAEKSGKTHLISRGHVISDTLVNYLVNMMLDAVEWNKTFEINRDLIVLLRERIGGEVSPWDREQSALSKRNKALFAALDIVRQGDTPSFRKIGKLLGVNASTVKRWFPEGVTFQNWVRKDGAPRHSSKKIEQMLRDSGLMILDEDLP
ncbi:MAG: hypothetical protein C0605_11920 [Hyphomicrobiales bacterium]|nr:MAG: hypothetical protein C0605_11920 [Hyphomicrobiales bacterium]